VARTGGGACRGASRAFAAAGEAGVRGAVQDTTAGIRDGEMWPIDERITGDYMRGESRHLVIVSGPSPIIP
jgi:hypothetical protein